MSGKYSLDRAKGKVAIMFLVNRVELIAIDKVHQVWKLHRDHAAWSEQELHAGYEIVQVRYVCQHIVCREQVGLDAFVHQSLCQISAEILDPRGNTNFSRRFGHFASRLDAQASNASLDEILEQIAVVAGQLDDKARAVQGKAIDHLRC